MMKSDKRSLKPNTNFLVPSIVSETLMLDPGLNCNEEITYKGVKNSNRVENFDGGMSAGS